MITSSWECICWNCTCLIEGYEGLDNIPSPFCNQTTRAWDFVIYIYIYVAFLSCFVETNRSYFLVFFSHEAFVIYFFSFFVSLFFLQLTIISHTKGHISYYVTGKEGEDPAVFTGDTLVSSKDALKLICCFYWIEFFWDNSMKMKFFCLGDFLSSLRWREPWSNHQLHANTHWCAVYCWLWEIFWRHSRTDVSVTLCNIGFIAKAYSSLLWPRGKDFFFLYLVSFFFSVPLNQLKFSYLLWTRSWGWMHDLYECSQLMWTFNWYHNNQINCMHVLCMFLLPLSPPWRSSPPSRNGTLLCWVLEFKRTLRVHVCDQSFAVRVLLEKLVLKALPCDSGYESRFKLTRNLENEF